MQGVPPLGLKGWYFNLIYNPAVVRVLAYDSYHFLAAGGPMAPLPLNDPIPDSDGNFLLGLIDNGPHAESGSGVLARVTLQAVGTGTSQLDLNETFGQGADGIPNLLPPGLGSYQNISAYDGSVAVGLACGAATPTPTPSLPPTPTPTPSPTPAPTAPPTPTPVPTPPPPPTEYEIAIDTDTTGNTATSVGAIDACRAASVGQTFAVDILVPEVPEPGYGGLAGNVLYNPAVLHVVASDYNLLLAADTPPAPNIFSLSDSGPDSDGDFRMDFLDLSSTDGETGPGVVARITFQAVGAGSTLLDLTDLFGQGILLIAPTGVEYVLSAERDAEVVVGGSCPALISDSDDDAFKDGREDNMGTLAAIACSATAAKNDEATDAWPVDNNDDQRANTIDVGAYVATLNSAPPDPRYRARLDLNANGSINTIDVGAFVAVLNQTCTP